MYIYFMVRPSREIYAQDGSMNISAKYFCAHLHAWATGHSNLAGAHVNPINNFQFECIIIILL